MLKHPLKSTRDTAFVRHSVMQLPLPEHEVARLEVLGKYQIFGTPPEECFDNITRLAAYVCGTPIALISFIASGSNRRSVGTSTRSRGGFPPAPIPSCTLTDEQTKTSALATYTVVCDFTPEFHCSRRRDFLQGSAATRTCGLQTGSTKP